jgi:biopolymer transport protein ExbD
MSDDKTDDLVDELPETGIGDGSPFMGWDSALKSAPSLKKGVSRVRPNKYAATITLTSLMDIITIILVYLLTSVAASPVRVPDKNIKLPLSNAMLIPEEAATITLTKDQIVVNDQAVAVLKESFVDPEDKRDGKDGLFITPLYDALTDAAETEKKIAQFNATKPFRGIAIILADKKIPYRLLTEVMYTAGQAEYANYKFAVIKKAQ